MYSVQIYTGKGLYFSSKFVKKQVGLEKGHVEMWAI